MSLLTGKVSQHFVAAIAVEEGKARPIPSQVAVSPPAHAMSLATIKHWEIGENETSNPLISGKVCKVQDDAR